MVTHPMDDAVDRPKLWPGRYDVMVHVLTGRAVSMFERWNHSQNPHYAEVRACHIDGAAWIYPLRLLRTAMSGERRAYKAAWHRRTGWKEPA
jgi:hypothetical protein